jgi:hypothetical protein
VRAGNPTQKGEVCLMSNRGAEFPPAVELFLSFCPPLDILPFRPEPAAERSLPERTLTLTKGDILELESLDFGSWDGDVEELLDTIPGV